MSPKLILRPVPYYRVKSGMRMTNVHECAFIAAGAELPFDASDLTGLLTMAEFFPIVAL
jgi:hypothetical protein